MVAEILVLLRSTDSGWLIGILLAIIVPVLAVWAAFKQSDEGYEDDSGFHFGTPERPEKGPPATSRAEAEGNASGWVEELPAHHGL